MGLFGRAVDEVSFSRAGVKQQLELLACLAARTYDSQIPEVRRAHRWTMMCVSSLITSLWSDESEDRKRQIYAWARDCGFVMTPTRGEFGQPYLAVRFTDDGYSAFRPQYDGDKLVNPEDEL